MLAPFGRDGHGLDEDDAQVLAERARLATLTAKAKQLSDLYDTGSQAYAASSQVLRSAAPGTALVEDDRPPKPTLNGKVSLLHQLEDARRRVAGVGRRPSPHPLQSLAIELLQGESQSRDRGLGAAWCDQRHSDR